MKYKIELDAKCRNCINWCFLDADDEFLEDNKTYCKLDDAIKNENQECEKLLIDVLTLENSLRSAGYKSLSIYK